MDQCYLPVEVVESIFAHNGHEEYIAYFILNKHTHKRKFDMTFWALHLDNIKFYVKFLHHLSTINDVPLFEFLLNGPKLTAKQTRLLVELVGSTGNVACFNILIQNFKNIELIAMCNAYHAALVHGHFEIMEKIFEIAPSAVTPLGSNLSGDMSILLLSHLKYITVIKLANKIILYDTENHIKKFAFSCHGTFDQYKCVNIVKEADMIDLIKTILRMKYGNALLAKDIIENFNISNKFFLEDILGSPNRQVRTIMLKSLKIDKLTPNLITNDMPVKSKHLLKQFVNDYPNEARMSLFLSFGTFDDAEYISMIKKYNPTDREIKIIYVRVQIDKFENLKRLFEENWTFLAGSWDWA